MPPKRERKQKRLLPHGWSERREENAQDQQIHCRENHRMTMLSHMFFKYQA